MSIFVKNENLEYNQSKVLPVDLNDKIDEFIDWYAKDCCEYDRDDRAVNMRNFIEKVAVWYELRYPNDEVKRLLLGYDEEDLDTDINKIMFDDGTMTWSEFYSTNKFIKSLPYDENCYFIKPRYPRNVYWKNHSLFVLTSKGVVEKAIRMGDVIPEYCNRDFKGMHIKDIVSKIKECGIIIPDYCDFEEAIKNYERQNYQKEEMLNCIMYRIIERGGSLNGAKRAFLFAKEFNRDIDVPMKYGVDFSDPDLRFFTNTYLETGGSMELECYVDYDSRENKREKVSTVKVQDIFKRIDSWMMSYTPKEDELHQRLVNALYGNIDQEELKEIQERQEKEKVKQLRLERKMKR